jgi:hypothetical protein
MLNKGSEFLARSDEVFTAEIGQDVGVVVERDKTKG